MVRSSKSSKSNKVSTKELHGTDKVAAAVADSIINAEQKPATPVQKTVGQMLDDAVQAFAAQRKGATEALETLRAKLTETQAAIAQHESTIANLDKDQADAVKAILSQNGVALEVFKLVPPTAEKSSRKRMTSDELTQAVEAVSKALSDKDHKSRSMLATELNLDVRTVVRALSKLARDGKAENNGVRGANGGWIKK